MNCVPLLENVLGGLGHEAVVTGDRDEALSRDDLDQFDLIISDLTEEAPANKPAQPDQRAAPQTASDATCSTPSRSKR